MKKTEPLNHELGQRFEQALSLAIQVHANQRRKDSGAPYIAHVLGVTALVLEDGGSEDEAIAALLHDSAEDQGGEEMLATIRAKFGEKIAAIVDECSDTLEMPKPPWQARKQNHLARLEHASPEAIRVMAADKVYNSRNLLRGLLERGDTIWENFKGGRDGTLWYFKQMHNILNKIHPGYLTNELFRAIEDIELISPDKINDQ